MGNPALAASRPGTSLGTNQIHPSSQDGSEGWTRERERTKSCSSRPRGSTLRNPFRPHSLLLKPLPCVLWRWKEPAPGFIYPVQARAQHSLPAAFSHSGLGFPARDTEAAGRGCDPRRSSTSYLGAGHWACSGFLPSQVSGDKKEGEKAPLQVD